jgi:hypothetical protein
MKFFYSTLLAFAVIPAAFADYYGNPYYQNSGNGYGYGYGQTEATSAGNAGATGKFSMTINAEGSGYMAGAADGNASTQGVVDAKANETGK